MQEPTHHIAATLKSLRGAQGWSLDRASRATGVSKAMLGQIERGESSPTVATLWKIAGGFRVSFSLFFEQASVEGGSPDNAAVTVLEDAAAGMTVTPLFAFDPALRFEMFLIELASGACSESSPHEPGVVEHVVMLDGTLELALDGHWEALGPGEARRFAADREHGYRNVGERAARFHDVIHYPQV
ncbi:XRE family transcriptional regulator [Chromohalobacter marismortui]|uniref:XRE family transcriptional regulator n=1 Tax=Chromohalobacter marismortui TaxID=42055 RepID=A0A4R7NVA4_9GAMM|nr:MULTISPECIES: helix-turn-helix domain-containing protein [Chromohalobacter]MCI0510332.1 helix-turn-helix domain-containing protein [Chromohalobacter sp.]MCI0592732.1 helix-turn-helix domain-containing protein [Chromohalobacter sp.]TDU25093.1 XRE family transcriptional regulator [Chromohalobacter marismortui]